MHKIMRAWDAGHNKVKYVYRDEETKRTNLGEAKFDWYFFVKNSDYETHRSTFALLKEQRKVVKYEQESHYTRVYIDRTHASELLDKDCNFVWEYRDREFFEVKELLRSRNIQTYEADLLIHKRWMIDNDIQFESEFKIVGLDIETDDEHLTGQIDPSRCKVLSCAFKDFITGKEAWVCAKSRSDEHEKEVLELIARVIATYDVLCGWNGCFVRGTKVLMIDGTIKNIEDMTIGDEIIGFDGKKSITTKVRNVFKHKNYKQIYKIKTNHREIMASEEHPFLVANSEIFDYVKVPNLKIGDYLCNFKNLNVENERHDYSHDDYKFAGMMLTDGHLEKYPGRSRMAFYNTNLKYINWIKRYLTSKNVEFGISQDHRLQHQKVGYQIRFGNMNLKNMLNWMGVPNGNKSYAKDVTFENIFIQDRKRIKKFLIGCYIGDGYKNFNHLMLPNINPYIQYWYKRLLSRIGVESWTTIDKKKNRPSHVVIKMYWEHIPSIFYKDMVRKPGFIKTGALADILNLKTPGTLRQLKKFMNNIPKIVNDVNFEKIESIESIEYSDYVFNIETESHNYVANDFIVHNCGFDFPVLKARFAMYGIVIDWRKKFLQDHMQIYKKLGPQLPSYSLDYVAKAVTGEGKMEHEEKIFELFLYNKPKLREYNLIDVRSMFNIETKTKFLGVAREVNTIGKCPCDDIYISRKIDNLILRRAYERGHFHFKTKVKQTQEEMDDESKFQGAYVFPPIPGIYKNVQVLDFHALYPSVIQSFNISPDTIIEEGVIVSKNDTITNPTGHKFRKDFIGIIPEIIKYISDMRNKYRAMMKECSDKNSIEYKTYERLAYVYKSFALSFYGVMGLKTSRFFDVRIAEATTLGGQFFTKTIAKYLESIQKKILSGDTDSLFICIDDRKEIPLIVSNINAICKDNIINVFNCNESHLSMEHDKTFAILLILEAKKRYAGYLIHIDGKDIPSQLYVKGLEYVRTDSSKLLKQEQKELLIKCLDGNTSETQMKDLIHKLRNFVLYDLKDIEMIKIAQKLSKEVDEYAVDMAHLKVVEDLRSKGIQVYVGDKIDYFIESQDREGKPIPKAARFFEGKFDRIYFWAKKLYPALERILKCAFPKTDWSRYKDFGSTKKMANSRQGRMDLW